MKPLNFIFFLQLIFVSCNVQQLKADANPFLAGKNTPVWFLESNPNDDESPVLQKIPNAINEAQLVDTNAEETSTNNNNVELKPNTLFVEVLVVADHTLYKKLGENIEDALKYIISFWTSVDLRYRSLTAPRIYINVAGIVIAKDPKALYYIEQSKNPQGHVNGNKVIFEAGKYFKNKKETADHDILVTLTGEDVCTVGKNDVCHSSTIGVSLIGKACHSHLSTAVVEDNGAFSGVIVSAHEIGHLLGVPHDGTGKSTYCMTHESYIMAVSIFENNENNFNWSHCSKKIFQELPSKPASECLRNKPNPGSPVKFLLPGQLLSANQQCERAGQTIPCFDHDRICKTLLCLSKDGKICEDVGITAEGTVCGENKYCLAGRCVAEA